MCSVPSTLCFIPLYLLAELGNRLLNTQRGIVLGEAKIPALFYADDMVLIADREEDLLYHLRIVEEFTIERGMQVNFSKTEIMKFGLGTNKIWAWILYDSKGIEKGRIQETESYKYLGLRLGKKRLFRKARASAVNCPNAAMAGEVYWRQKIKPALLYGAEVIPYTKDYIRKIQTAQNKAGRWILGVSGHTAIAGIQAELGWTSIDSEVKLKKPCFGDR